MLSRRESAAAILGIDIGGAHLKAATATGDALCVPFPLWREPDGLSEAIAAVLSRFPHIRHLAVTLTGELCDCWEDRDEGVCRIVDAVERAARPSRSTASFWTFDRGLTDPSVVRAHPAMAGAANWHALATWLARRTSVPALLIDCGSTTTDIIRLADNAPRTEGWSDVERLQSGELLYCGVGRTPVCSLVDTLEIAGRATGVAREVFATTRDAWLIRGEIAEDAASHDTADGRPATCAAARQRLARCVCADATDLPAGTVEAFAATIAGRQEALLAESVERVVQHGPHPARIIIAGSGEFLASRVARAVCPQVEIASLARELGPAVSEAACAYALANLMNDQAREQLRRG